MQVRARFVCESVADFGEHGEGDHRQVSLKVTLRAIWTGHKADNNYSKATPSGEMTMTVTNPALEGVFRPGKVYDITLVEHMEGTGA